MSVWLKQGLAAGPLIAPASSCVFKLSWGGHGFNQVLQQTQPTKCREGDDRHGLQCENRSVRAGQEVWQKQTGSDPFACCVLVERSYSSTVWELYE